MTNANTGFRRAKTQAVVDPADVIKVTVQIEIPEVKAKSNLEQLEGKTIRGLYNLLRWFCAAYGPELADAVKTDGAWRCLEVAKASHREACVALGTGNLVAMDEFAQTSALTAEKGYSIVNRHRAMADVKALAAKIDQDSFYQHCFGTRLRALEAAAKDIDPDRDVKAWMVIEALDELDVDFEILNGQFLKEKGRQEQEKIEAARQGTAKLLEQILDPSCKFAEFGELHVKITEIRNGRGETLRFEKSLELDGKDRTVDQEVNYIKHLQKIDPLRAESKARSLLSLLEKRKRMGK